MLFSEIIINFLPILGMTSKHKSSGLQSVIENSQQNHALLSVSSKHCIMIIIKLPNDDPILRNGFPFTRNSAQNTTAV